MHAHFHNSLHLRGSTGATAQNDSVNNNPGSTGAAGDTVLVDENEAALVDENGNAISVN